MNTETEILDAIQKELAIELPEQVTLEQAARLMAAEVNHLIETDFQKLVNLLYRIDVSEVKLKKMLSENPGNDTGMVITRLIIERQLQKIESRRQFKQQGESDNIDENEKW